MIVVNVIRDVQDSGVDDKTYILVSSFNNRSHYFYPNFIMFFIYHSSIYIMVVIMNISKRNIFFNSHLCDFNCDNGIISWWFKRDLA